MSLALIRTEIKTIMDGIDDVGIVHDFERFSPSWEKFLLLFKPPGKKYIRGWEITRKRSTEKGNSEDDTATHQYRRFHQMVIKGYYGLQDETATEKIFQDLVETICDTFRANHTLNDTAEDCGTPQAERVETRMFGNVLCHYGEIHLKVEEEYII